MSGSGKPLRRPGPALWWAGLAVWLGAVWWLSSRTFAPHPGFEIPHADKAAHFVWFAVGAGLLAAALVSRWNLRPRLLAAPWWCRSGCSASSTNGTSRMCPGAMATTPAIGWPTWPGPRPWPDCWRYAAGARRDRPLPVGPAGLLASDWENDETVVFSCRRAARSP